MTRGLALALVIMTAGVAHAGGPHCHETSPVLGYRRCGGFGSGWAHSRFESIGADIGLVVQRIALHALSATGTSYSPSATAPYRVMVAPGANLRPIGVGPRLAVGYRWSLVHAMFELSSSVLDGPRVISSQNDGPAMSRRLDIASDLDVAVGAHKRIGDWGVGAEVAVGMRGTSLLANLPAGFTTCPDGATGRNCGAAIEDTRALIEPRVQIEYWLARHDSLRLTTGYAVLGDGESIALSIAFHNTPYDGN